LQAAAAPRWCRRCAPRLTDSAEAETDHVRQVVFLTDGAIGNEQQLFETITAMRGRSRVFMVGIGSAPNTYLMTRASELGRGAFTHIGSVEQVEERMRGLFSKLENPAVTGLTAKFSDAAADITPAAIPDLYRDEPLLLAAKTRQALRLSRDQGPHRRPALERHAAAGERGRGQGPVQIVGAAQDQRCRGRPHLAAGEPRRTPTRPSWRWRWSIKLVTRADQPGRGRPDAEPSRRRAAQARGTSDQPAGRLGFREGVRRASEAADTADRTACRGGRTCAGRGVEASGSGHSPATITLPRTATDAELSMILGAALLAFSLMLLAFRRREALAR